MGGNAHHLHGDGPEEGEHHTGVGFDDGLDWNEGVGDHALVGDLDIAQAGVNLQLALELDVGRFEEGPRDVVEDDDVFPLVEFDEREVGRDVLEGGADRPRGVRILV